jgi:hypothetical protein
MEALTPGSSGVSTLEAEIAALAFLTAGRRRRDETDTPLADVTRSEVYVVIRRRESERDSKPPFSERVESGSIVVKTTGESRSV